MNILGVDFGLAHTGIALGSTDTGLVEPYAVFASSSAISDIMQLCQKEGIEQVVIGLSEGKSAKHARALGRALRRLGLAVDYSDETLSTLDAKKRLLHLTASKRAQLEHAGAAAVILELWLSDHV